MKKIVLLCLAMYSVCYAGTYDRVKTKLNTYITNKGYTLTQLKAFTDTQITNWLNNHYPQVDKQIVKQALAEIIKDREMALVFWLGGPCILGGLAWIGTRLLNLIQKG